MIGGVRDDRNKVGSYNDQVMLIDGEKVRRPSGAVNKPQQVPLALRESGLEVRSAPTAKWITGVTGEVAVTVQKGSRTVRGCTIDLDLEVREGTVMNPVRHQPRPQVDVPIGAAWTVNDERCRHAVWILERVMAVVPRVAVLCRKRQLQVCALKI